MWIALSLCAFITASMPAFAPAETPQTSSRAKAPLPAAAAVALPAEPGLYAIIYTSMGVIVCRLFESSAPKTVANFVGLAQGSKSWTDPRTGKPTRSPLYAGTTFHRVIPGFMIQGGDPLGDGTGTPGYEFQDEIDPKRTFERPGVLAMANSGPNTNGSQFFITVAPETYLDGHYSIFGEVVAGQDVADSISQVSRNSDDKPLKPIVIQRIAIRRVHPKPAEAAGAGANKKASHPRIP